MSTATDRCHRPTPQPRRGIPEARRALPRGRLTIDLTIALALALALAATGCGRKGSGPASRAPISWEGLSLGMPVGDAKARMKALGWSVTCLPAGSVMYLTSDTLKTAWVKAKEKGRTERCDALLPRGPGANPKTLSGLLRAKLFFLDGALRQMNIVLAQGDGELSQTLKGRWGTPLQTEVAVELFAARKKGSIRVFVYRQKGNTVLWLRKARLQELIFLEHEPAAVAPLDAIATEKKDG